MLTGVLAPHHVSKCFLAKLILTPQQHRARHGGHRAHHLSVDVKVIPTHPCIFCMGNHY
jgi:hypothetical protein